MSPHSNSMNLFQHRTLRVLVYALAAMLLAAVLLHTPPARELVRRLAVAAAGESLELGELDYSLWRGEVRARGVVWSSPFLSVRVPELVYRHGFFEPTRIEVRSPDVRLTERDAPVGDEGGPAASFLIPAFLLRSAVELEEANVAVSLPEATVELSSMDVGLEPSPRGWDGEVVASSGAVRLGSRSLPLDAVALRLTIERGSLSIDSAQVESGASRFTATGSIESYSPFAMKIDVEHAVDGEFLARLVEDLSIAGTLPGDATLGVTPGEGLGAEGTLRSERLVYGELEPLELSVSWRFAGDRFVVDDGDVRGYGGVARVSGTIDLGADTQSFDVDLRDFTLSRLDARLRSQVSGEVSARIASWELDSLDGEGSLDLSAGESGTGLPLHGSVALQAEDGVIRFEAPELRARSLRVSASGRFEHAFDADFRARVMALDDLSAILRDLGVEAPAAPLAGELLAEGTLTGEPDDLAVRASLGSEGLRVADVPFELEGDVAWSDSRLSLDSIVARRDDGGELVLEGVVAAGAGGWNLTARADGLDLSVASGFADFPIGGTLDGEARLTGTAPDVDARFEVRELALGEDFEGGSLSVTARKRGPRIEVERLVATRDGARFTAEGSYDLDSEVAIARGSAEGLRAAWLPTLPEVEGSVARLDFDVEGRLESPEGSVSARLEGWTLRGVSLADTAIRIQSNGETARLEAQFVGGETWLTGGIEIAPPYPAFAEIDVGLIPWTPLLRAFAEAEAAETRLELEGTAGLSLPLSSPGELRYELEAERALGTYRDVVFGASAPFSVSGDLDALTVSNLTLVGADTAVGLDGIVPLSAEGTIDLTARGALRLELLELWLPEAEPAGRANAEIRVEGTLSQPTFRGDVVVEEASAVVAGIPVTDVNASATWSENVLIVQRASGAALDGRFEVRGEIAPRPGEEIYARLDFDVDGVDPSRLLEGEQLWESLDLSFSGQIESEGADLANLRGSGTVDEVTVVTGAVALANRGPADWTLSGGTLTLPELRIVGGESDVRLSAEARPFAEPLEWSAGVEGVVNHGFLSPALSDSGITVSGLTELSVRARGGPDGLSLEGQGSWSGARVVLQDPPLAVTSLTGGFELLGDRILVRDLRGNAGGGTVEVSGSIALAEGGVSDLELQTSASDVRLSYPEGLRSELDAEIRLTGNPSAMRLSGVVDLDRAVFSRNINIETELLRSFSTVTAVSAPSELGSAVRLDLEVRAADALRIDNNLAQLGASANLTVAGTLATPELYGVVSAQSGGRFRFGRNVYQIESGRITFQGYPLEPPEIDVAARTTVAGRDLRLAARGTTDNLVTTLEAPDDPTLTRADVASLLVTGRTVDRISTEGRTAIGEQMASYLGATLADLAQLGIGEALPFQIVTVEPALIAREVDPNARFTLGAAFTDDLTVVYSIGLNDAETQIWIVDYGLPRRARAQMIRRDTNDYTFGVLQQIPVDFHARPLREEEVRAVVGSSAIVYRGDDRPEADAELASSLRPRPGSRYDYWRAWEEADRIREALRGEGYLEATVDVATSSCGEGCVDVRYVVELGLPVAFLWEGEIDEALGDALAEAWNGRLGESFLTSDLEQLAEGRLFSDGFFLAEAEASTQRTDQGLTVRVRVDRGPRGRRVVLDFVGNEGVGQEALAAGLPPRRSAAFYDLLTTKRPRLKQLLRLEYASFGYLGAEVGDPETRFDETTGAFRVDIPIVEGPRYVVEAIELEGVESLSEESMRARLPLRIGGVFRATDFLEARSAIASLYRQQGFPDVDVAASIVDGSTESGLVARFVVVEGTRATVGSVSVAGNDATSESIIRREVRLEPGEPLRLSDVSETQKQLYDLDVFRSAEVVVGEPPAEGTSRDVTVRVVEASDLRLDYGLRAGTDGFLEVLGEVNAPNVFGRAHHAGLRALIGTERQILRFNYHSPYLARYRLDTDFFVERVYETLSPDEGLESQNRTWTFTTQQTRRLGERLNAQWSYSYQRAVSEFDDPFFGPTTISLDRSILTVSMIGDARDSVLRPTRGNLWSATFQAAPEALGSDAQFVKLYGQYFGYVPLGNDVIWASGYRVGLGKLLSASLLPEDRFQAGGPNTVRGFEQGSLGPFNEIAQQVIGGAGLLVFNQEIRFPVLWRLRGAAFWDAGNTFETVDEMKLGDLRHSVGMGARFDLPFGLFRLDWAWVVDRRGDEDPWQLVFSLGHAF